MRFTQWLPGALLAAALAAPAPGQSLLVNSTFDHDVSGWDKWGASQLAWSSADARGSSSSGSIVVTNSGTIESESQGIEQCVALEAGKTYVLSGRARIA